MTAARREIVGGASFGEGGSELLARLPGSQAYMDQARQVIVRGAASASRAGRRPTALVIDRAEGCRLHDVDGNAYLDYCLAYGPMLLGHNPPAVVEAVRAQLERGVLYGSQHRGELELAERVVRLVPGAELVAFAGSGSDAVHAAIRIARAATGRQLVLKFEGHYHGWIDPVYVNVPGVVPQEGPGPLPVVHGTAGLGDPGGVVVTRWNDVAALEETLLRHGEEIAVVLMEPIACNFGCFEAAPGYLERARELCDRYGCLLCFDEVITGFRVALGGAQERCGVNPDLAIFAKALASGFPIALVAGTERALAPAATGPVFHLGTYNGNATAVAAAVATLETLEAGGAGLYEALEWRAARLASGLRSAARDAEVPLVVMQSGAVLQLLWDTRDPVRSYAEAWASDPARVADAALHLLAEGIHVLERGLLFVSTEHGDAEIDETVAAARLALARVAAA
jgi:glutamate-1-semialdehyde 2,1-aminomutase